DILANAHDLHGLAVFIAQYRRATRQPPLGAVRPHDPIFGVVLRSALQRVRKRRDYARPILRMNLRAPLRSRDMIAAGQPEDLPDLWRPSRDIASNLVFPRP